MDTILETMMCLLSNGEKEIRSPLEENLTLILEAIQRNPQSSCPLFP